MQSLVRATQVPGFPARIVGVISNKPDAAGLDFARSLGLPTAVVQLKSHPDKDAADAAITRQLEDWGAEWVCLAGFMRVLSAGFTRRWQGRLLNIHPSLLPKYKGLDTHQRALDAGDTEHGCTVHQVIPELDEGPVISQVRVPIFPGDDAETLAARVLIEEHKLYPAALAKAIRESRSGD
ncbi:MAG: phosphoribosylglycinamide formyltransferase [Hyphomicrobiaceae bacterium]|nr:phosphoribosylglycinamide formyltransferase [Hyphomicrobiaceae bacterium]MCC0023585.1 phosphoribosylglycinamide formyltransferase [Hyphomicrobiaceae bacterium]